MQEDSQNMQGAGSAPEQNTSQSTETQNQEAAMMVSDNEKLFSTLCYIPGISILTVPIALYKCKNSKFTDHHATQGLGLFILYFVISLVAAVIPFMAIAWLVLIALSAFGGWSAWMGNMLNIPFVYQLGGTLIDKIKGMLEQTVSPAKAQPTATASTPATPAPTPEPMTTAQPAPVATPEPTVNPEPVQEEAPVQPATENAAAPVVQTPTAQAEEQAVTPQAPVATPQVPTNAEEEVTEAPKQENQ